MAAGLTWISLSQMALRLHITWQRAWRLALEGKVRAEQRGSRWYVVEADVGRLAREARVRGGEPAGAP